MENIKTREFTTSILFILFLIFSIVSSTKANPIEKPVDDLGIIKEKIELLNGKAFMPVLLPVIMENKEILGLTDEQISNFKQWRHHHLTVVLEKMQLIIEKSITFKKLSIEPNHSNDDLLRLQNEIFQLQQDVLVLKLECRNHLTQTFSPEQWDDFNFILADHPVLSNLL